VDEQYETALPLDTEFRDHNGQAVSLRSLWDPSRPALLHFVSYSCATVCDLTLTSIGTTLGQQQWTVGQEYDVYTISMNPNDTPHDAADARGRILTRYARVEAERGWHFLVGDEAAIAQVASAVGYRFRWDPSSEQFAHPAVLMVTRAGENVRISRYLRGIEYTSNDVRLSLAEAADGGTLSPVDSALLYCFRFDAHEGRYVIVAWRVMRIGGTLAALLLFGALIFFWRRELR
jgi:protein SCO1/2